MKKYISVFLVIVIVALSITSASAAVSTEDEANISASIAIGDVNGDGSLTIDDVTAIQKYLANLKNNIFYKSKSDYNYDGTITIDDVSMLQKRLAGVIIEYNSAYYNIDAKNKKCSLLNYHGTSSNVTLPATVKGYSVITINSYAFQNNSSILTVTVPKTVIRIDDYAFYNCKNFTKLIYKNKNMTWGYSFVNCPKFKQMTLG